MKKASSQVFHAVLITILACTIVFGLGVYIFGSKSLEELNNLAHAPDLTMTASTFSESILIPIPLDNNGLTLSGSEDPLTGAVIENTGTTENTGVITPCTREYMPVCGDDNNTYPNACVANSVGVVTMTPGECKKLETSTPVPPIQSGATATQPTPPKDEDMRACTMEYAPICGIDNKTYSNTCMAGDVAIAHIGECEGAPKKLFDTGSYILYSNASLGYSIAMPKYSHYAGAGARDGASHTIAIATTASGVTDFVTAPVQVWFYRKTPANPPSAESAQAENGIIYVKNNDTTGNVKVGTIIETVLESVK